MYQIDLSSPVRCSMAGQMIQKNGWETHGERRIGANLFVFVIFGTAHFTIEGKPYPLSQGDVLIVPANTLYSAHTDDVCRYYFFHFHAPICTVEQPDFAPRQLPSPSFRLQEPAQRSILIENGINVGENFNLFLEQSLTCSDRSFSGRHADRLLLECEFTRILLMLSALTEDRHTADRLPPILSKMTLYIRRSLTQPLTVSRLCSHFGISASYAARLFKKHLGVSPVRYINREKLRHAAELLTNSSMNVGEIADYLGFCDVFYFSRLFKNQFGVPPSRFGRQ